MHACINTSQPSPAYIGLEWECAGAHEPHAHTQIQHNHEHRSQPSYNGCNPTHTCSTIAFVITQDKVHTKLKHILKKISAITQYFLGDKLQNIYK